MNIIIDKTADEACVSYNTERDEFRIKLASGSEVILLGKEVNIMSVIRGHYVPWGHSSK